MSQGNTILHNTTLLVVATIAQKLLATLYFILIARLFTNAEIGQYTFVISFTTLLGIFIELGLSNVLIKEVAQTGASAQRFLSNILGIKLVASLVVYPSLIFLSLFLGYSSLMVLLMLAGTVMLLDAFHTSFYGIFRGLQKFQFESLGIILGQILLVIFGIVFAIVWHSLPLLLGALLISSAFHFVFSLGILKKKYAFSFSPKLEKPILKELFKIGLPFFIAALFMRFYGYIDIVLLFSLTSPIDVSFYTAAYKITLALTFIPAALGSVLFPSFSHAFITMKENLAPVFEKAMYMLSLLSIPLMIGSMVLAQKIIFFIYPESYAPSILVLQVLMIALVFIFLSYPSGALLNACGLQKKNTIIMGITLVVNILVNIMFIPLFSSLGAAFAMVLSSFVLFSFPLYYVQRIIHYNRRFLLLGVLKVLFSSFIMALALFFFKNQFHILALIPLGAAVYFGCLFLVGGYNRKDLVFIRNILQSQKRG